MAGYIYLPFPNGEMITRARSWATGQGTKGKTPYHILRPSSFGALRSLNRQLGNGVLRNLSATDKLYILAHGDYNALMEDESGTGKTYTAQRMATVLVAEGLPYSFADLRVFACDSGSRDPDNPSHMPFAWQLLRAMRSHGYMHLSVCGYEGEVFQTYRIRDDDPAVTHKGVEVLFPNAPGSQSGRIEIHRASSRRIRFDI